jgi:hypothetical protein
MNLDELSKLSVLSEKKGQMGEDPSEIHSAVTVVPQLNGPWVQRGKNLTPVEHPEGTPVKYASLLQE